MIAPEEPRDKMHLQAFGQLPVSDGGRFKPIDTYARVNLMLISNRQYFVDEEGKSQPAVKWLLDAMVSRAAKDETAPALQHKVFRIENDQVLALLGLEERPGLRYALTEFRDKIEELDK